MDIEYKKLRRYLLGDLPDEETAEISEMLLDGNQLDEQVGLETENLIEDYLEDSLSANDLDLFRSNFLISKQRIREVNEIGLLRSYARDRASTLTESPGEAHSEPSYHGFFARIQRLPNLQLAFSAAAVAVVLVSVMYFAFRPITDLDAIVAGMNQRDLSDVASLQIQKVTVSPGSVRNEGGRPKAVQAPSEILFRLMLPEGWDEEVSYNASLTTSDKNSTLFSLDRLKVYQVGTVREFRILVPAARIPKGRLAFIVTKDETKSDSADYFFDVE